ncbi:Protein disulfide-isomerase MPD1 [Leucoagaricus sp. SymC.cos]|nr:Protein disulfide-isomerase MPD1 [Leucoagaricus sp. SymC.cos]
MLSRVILTCIVLAPALALADTLFAKDSLVKMLEPNSFENALEPNQTSMIAFISPSTRSSDHERLASDFEKAALGLHPFVPTYAVDCERELNQELCKEQGVEVYPTVKLFPRGKTTPSLTFDDSNEGSASAYYYWASRRIPKYVIKKYFVEDLEPWIAETRDKHTALLLTKEKKIPLLWSVLANKYAGQLEMVYHRDRKGRSSMKLGMEAGGKKEAKILVYPAGSTTPVRYEGINKMDSISKFFDSLLDVSVDLKAANKEAMEEKFVPDKKELEIERKQEAQRLALAHGGFASLIDFEKAIKEGHGADYHDVHGYPGMMGEVPAGNKEERTEEGGSEQLVGGEEGPEEDLVTGSSGGQEPSRFADEL